MDHLKKAIAHFLRRFMAPMLILAIASMVLTSLWKHDVNWMWSWLMRHDATAEHGVVNNDLHKNFENFEADRKRNMMASQSVFAIEDHAGLLANMDPVDDESQIQIITALTSNQIRTPVNIDQNSEWHIIRTFSYKGIDACVVTSGTGYQYEQQKVCALVDWFRAPLPEDRDRKVKAALEAAENDGANQSANRPVNEGITRALPFQVGQARTKSLGNDIYQIIYPAGHFALYDAHLDLNPRDRIKIEQIGGLVNGGSSGNGAFQWVDAQVGWRGSPRKPDFLNCPDCHRELLVGGSDDFMCAVLHFRSLQDGRITSTFAHNERILSKCHLLVGVNEPWSEGDQPWADNSGEVVMTIKIQRNLT